MLSRNKKPLLIGICGRSGAGKTFVLDLLRSRLGEQICILSQDHYYRPLETQQKDALGQVNFDLPSAIDEARFVRDLEGLLEGNAIELREYTFNNPALVPRTIHLAPAPVIVVEGLFVFHFERIRRMLSLKVFIDTDENTALERRLERDLRARAYPAELIRYQWTNHVQPAYRQFVLPHKESADLVIRNNAAETPALEPLLEWVSSRLNPGKRR